jgi:EmrB/QacA subfamily drug resistance transporter
MARSEAIPDERAGEAARNDATFHATAASMRQPNKWTVLAIVAIGVLMATIDSSIVNISLPSIAAYFAVPLSGTVEWVIIAYLVVIAGLLLSVGRLADLIGRKWIWAAGLASFTLGSALCGAAPTLELLVAERAFQGIGAALLMAISPAMLTSAFPPTERGRALGFNAVVVAVGVSIGPTLGGFLTEHYTWRSIFYVNVPLGIIGLVATLLVLRDNTPRRRTRFDPLGAALLALGLSALTLGLSFGEEWGWTSARVVAAGAVALVALVALVLLELRIEAPVVDLRMLRDRVFLSANLALVLSFLALFAVSFLLPFYLEQLRGFSTQDSGLLLTPLPLTIAVVAPISGSLADRFGTRWLAASGMAVACVGLLLISQLNATSSVPDIIWRLCVTGVGQGLFQSPNNSALMGAAPPSRQGTASGFLATGRVMGQSVSVALAGAIFVGLGAAQAGAILSSGQPLPPDQVAALQTTFTTGFHDAFVVCAAIAVFGVFASLVRGKER